MAAPPSRIGSVHRIHDTSEHTVPRMPSHVRRICGSVALAGAAVRSTQFTLQAEMHFCCARDAERGSPRDNSRSRASSSGLLTWSSTQLRHAEGSPTGLPRTGRQHAAVTRGTPGKKWSGTPRSEAGTRTAHFPRFSCSPSFAASASRAGRSSWSRARGRRDTRHRGTIATSNRSLHPGLWTGP